MYRTSLTLAAFALAGIATAAPRPEPLRMEEAPARARQMAEAFASICRNDDRSMASMKRRAEAGGFIHEPKRDRFDIDRSVIFSEFVMPAGGDMNRPPLLFLKLVDERRADGSFIAWQCVVTLPAGSGEPDRREVDAVFNAVNAVMPGQAWKLNEGEGPLGRFFIAEQTLNGIGETFATDFGTHHLTRERRSPAGAIEVPR